MLKFLSAMQLLVSVVVLIGISPSDSDASRNVAVAAYRIDGTAVRPTDRLSGLRDSRHIDRWIDPPTFGSTRIQDMVLLIGHRVSVSLPEATGGAGTVRYSLSGSLPPGITFEASTRLLSGTPTVAISRYAYTYVATDGNNATAELTFTISVQESGIPAFPPGTSVNDLLFVVDKQHLYPALPSATGGDGTLTYTLNPSLPAGLYFNNTTRVISGTASSTFSPITYTFFATDVDGDQTPNPPLFNISVESNYQPTFGATPTLDYTFTEGEKIETVLFPSAYGGNGTLTYAMTGLPSGLKFNPVTRELTGTPDQEIAAAAVSYTATDFDGDQISASITITVLPGAGTPLAFVSGISDRTYVVNQAIPCVSFPTGYWRSRDDRIRFGTWSANGLKLFFR